MSPEGGEYDVEKQQLSIKLKTSSISLDSSLKEEEKLAKTKLFKDSHYYHLLSYHQDSKTRSQNTVTCLDEFGVGYKNLHSKKDSNNYLINALGLDIEEELILTMSPQEAKEYFQADETSLNDRLQVRVNLEPIAPFYTTYSKRSGGSCPLGKFAKNLANTYGTTTEFKTNHLIHGNVSYLKIFDRVTGETLYSISPNK